MSSDRFSRRSFLKRSSMGALAGLAAPLEGVVERIPIEPSRFSAQKRPVDTMACALIGYGVWGREIAATLMRLDETDLVTVCDNYPLMLRRVDREIPDLHTTLDYREVLDDPAIQAVLVATPTHLHREIVVASLEAGKHVYCEAPLAHTVDDSRAIAREASAHPDHIFQGGLLYRTEPQYRSVFGFIRSGALGQHAFARSQWHAKESWRRISSSSDRTSELNWRLDPDISLGLAGEIAIQQIDTTMWIYDQLPVQVTGFGNVMFWKDGRDVADTMQSVLEFPNGEHLMVDATLVSGFDAAYDLFFGSDATIILRDNKAWMFKEVDAPQLGWEVYARRDRFYKETGIALLANATKLDALGQDPTEDDPNAETPLFHALKSFAENFFYGPFEPEASAKVSHEATVVAVNTHRAVTEGTRVDIDPSDFAI